MTVRTIAIGEAAPDENAALLVERAKAGDNTAFELLIRPRMERLLRLALSILGDESDARDAIQEGCLSAWRQLPRLRDADRFEAWLWRIVVNECRTTLRQRGRASVREITVDDLASTAEPALAGRSFSDTIVAEDAIQRAFRRLDADKRLILVLHHVEDRPIGEIAVLLGIPEGTAKWRLHNARKALARAMEVER